MIKKLLCFFIFSLIPLPCVSQESISSFNETDFIDAVQKNLSSDELNDFFQTLDINNDRHISENEALMFSAGAYPSDKKRQAEIANLFHQADTDKNNRLDFSESKKFLFAVQEIIIKEKLNDIMPFLNPAQPPSLEESEKMLNESLKKLEKATQDLKKIDPQTAAKNMINGMMTALADENFYQMDKKKDNCVTRENYAAYNIELQQNTDRDSDFKLSYQDFLEIYDEIKKKNPDCLTKEEYMIDYIEEIPPDLSGI